MKAGRLVVGAFVTVDGVMQAPGAPDEDRTGGFQHGGWSVPYWDDMMNQLIVAEIRKYDSLLLGRKTYDVFATSWPKAEKDDPIAEKLNAMPKFVVTRGGSRFSWENTTFLTGDVAAEVSKLKENAGAILVQGSTVLIQTLLAHDLIDEFFIWTFPVVVGPGKRLFAEGTRPSSLRLLDVKTSSTGVIMQSFLRGGPVQTGTMAVEGEETVQD